MASNLTLLTRAGGTAAQATTSGSNPDAVWAVSGSASCASLGIARLVRVPKIETPHLLSSHSHGQTTPWPRGHYPWPACAVAPHAATERRPLAVLIMVADSTYASRVPEWAALVRSIGASCAVGDVGNERDAAPARALGRSLFHGRIPAGIGGQSPAAEPPASAELPVASAACAAVAAARCECFDPPTRARAGSHRANEGSALALAVRWRFRYALALLHRGSDVLMHDADVFYSKRGLDETLRIVHATRFSSRRPTGTVGRGPVDQSSSNLDFVIQPNGKRREAYDDLNWGFVFVGSTPRAIAILQCALDTWTNPAFRGPLPPRASWHRVRSQPWLNHILEAAVSAARAARRMSQAHLSVFPKALFSRSGRDTVVHFTGYGTSHWKLLCAMADGYLPPLAGSGGVAGNGSVGQREGGTVLEGGTIPDGKRKTIVYLPPLSAKSEQQATALAAAYHLASATGASVALPPATHQSRDGAGPSYIPLCLLIDVGTFPIEQSVAPPKDATGERLCAGAAGASLRDATELLQETSPGVVWCVSFESLLRYHLDQTRAASWWRWPWASPSPGPRMMRPPRTCEPWSKAVQSNHACT